MPSTSTAQKPLLRASSRFSRVRNAADVHRPALSQLKSAVPHSPTGPHHSVPHHSPVSTNQTRDHATSPMISHPVLTRQHSHQHHHHHSQSPSPHSARGSPPPLHHPRISPQPTGSPTPHGDKAPHRHRGGTPPPQFTPFPTAVHHSATLAPSLHLTIAPVVPSTLATNKGRFSVSTIDVLLDETQLRRSSDSSHNRPQHSTTNHTHQRVTTGSPLCISDPQLAVSPDPIIADPTTTTTTSTTTTTITTTTTTATTTSSTHHRVTSGLLRLPSVDRQSSRHGNQHLRKQVTIEEPPAHQRPSQQNSRSPDDLDNNDDDDNDLHHHHRGAKQVAQEAKPAVVAKPIEKTVAKILETTKDDEDKVSQQRRQLPPPPIV